MNEGNSNGEPSAKAQNIMLSSRLGKTPNHQNSSMVSNYVNKDLNNARYNNEVANIQGEDDLHQETVMKEKFGVR